MDNQPANKPSSDGTYCNFIRCYTKDYDLKQLSEFYSCEPSNYEEVPWHSTPEGEGANKSKFGDSEVLGNDTFVIDEYFREEISFYDRLEGSLTLTQELIRSELNRSINVSKINESLVENSDVVHYVGRGRDKSCKTDGSAKLNFLTALSNNSREFRNIMGNYKLSKNVAYRKICNPMLQSSAPRQRYVGVDLTDEEVSREEIPIFNLDTPCSMVTRSKGIPLKLPNVQDKVLEYKVKKYLSDKDK